MDGMVFFGMTYDTFFTNGVMEPDDVILYPPDVSLPETDDVILPDVTL